MADPQFGADVGFYLFELPFLSFVLDWLFIAVLVTLVLTAATHVLNGGVVFASPVPSVRSASKAHIAVLLAVLAALKAADYWVSRYDLTNTQRGFVQGATYAVVKAQVPALMLLMLIAVLTAGLFLVSIRTGSWRLPLLASALWVVVAIVGGLIFPALVQRLVVRAEPAGPRAAVHRAQRRGNAIRPRHRGRHPGDRDVRRAIGAGDRRRPRPAAQRPPAQPSRDEARGSGPTRATAQAS